MLKNNLKSYKNPVQRLISSVSAYW